MLNVIQVVYFENSLACKCDLNYYIVACSIFFIEGGRFISYLFLKRIKNGLGRNIQHAGAMLQLLCELAVLYSTLGLGDHVSTEGGR